MSRCASPALSTRSKKDPELKIETKHLEIEELLAPNSSRGNSVSRAGVRR
jgi:hypothetical protein